ncbi:MULTISPECIES: helix-turn-helix domain-containing protein [unclassified Emticicia]|uniref:winged helix-turn-helix transcriptional regulator n=1 Tax=unclassified Emticicia TaxID=2627301 RepID=UPI000C78B6F7|nr:MULTISPECIES: helix-turn-helix domain-containing protein [unclassified Emticicia]PLK44365.1 transcriptional regulator [Emticicia sp. TH156]UTA66699.1 helix-turn-helix transcriptional regulator [Emticicia sp. 21SJ11W-3]
MTTTTAEIKTNLVCPLEGGVPVCPTQDVLKLLTSKWTLQVLFILHVTGKSRFSEFLRRIHGSNKQTLSVALKDLTQNGYILKNTIQLKPLHIEYCLTDKGKQLIPLLRQFEAFN